MKESYGTLSQTINGLKKEGYLHDFNVVNAQLSCEDRAGVLSPKAFKIDKIYRFEGASNPDDQSILYAISSVIHNLRGILVNGYGVYADGPTNDLVTKLEHVYTKP